MDFYLFWHDVAWIRLLIAERHSAGLFEMEAIIMTQANRDLREEFADLLIERGEEKLH